MAQSLIRLKAQVDTLAPRRSRVSDGTIGNLEHSSRTSDHNPGADGIVRALDVTHDPAGGMDAHALAARLLEQQDPRLKYVISNGRIGSGPGGPSPGQWRPYAGPNAHERHAHVSVVAGPPGDRDGAWTLTDPPQKDDDMTPEQAHQLKVATDQSGEALNLLRDLVSRVGAVQWWLDPERLKTSIRDAAREANANLPEDVVDALADKLTGGDR